MSNNDLYLKDLESDIEVKKNELNKLKSEIFQDPDYNAVSLPDPYNPAKDGGLWLSGMLLFFSFLVICILSYLIKQDASKLESLLKVFGTILIIVVSIFLIVAGYSEKQIAPVIGLLGTLAGYLLGKQNTK